MKEVIIDGNRFSTLEEFYDEIDRLLTRDLPWKTGHNLNAFNDILRGGFGFHEYGEKLHIVWINASKSKIDFGSQVDETFRLRGNEETLFDVLVSIILDNNYSGHDCELELID